jgi:hypothetical protein
LILTVEVGGLVRITPVPGWLRHPNASRTLRDAAPTAAESDPPSRAPKRRDQASKSPRNSGFSSAANAQLADGLSPKSRQPSNVQSDEGADFGATAYSQARRREHEASSNAMAREWNRVALAVARKTGQTVGLNASTRIAMDAKPVAQFRIQFFGRAPTILGEVDLLALDAVTAIRQAAHAAWPPGAIGFCVIDREDRAVFGGRKADRW